MKLQLLSLLMLMLLAMPAYSQVEGKVHQEEKARPVKTYQGVKKMNQLFFLSTEELKKCFRDEKIPSGFPGYNSSLDEEYNKSKVKAWYELVANREKLNEEGVQKIESYLND